MAGQEHTPTPGWAGLVINKTNGSLEDYDLERGVRLREAFKNKGVYRKELSARLDHSIRSIQRWQNGEPISLGYAVIIAEFFGERLGRFIFLNTDDRTPSGQVDSERRQVDIKSDTNQKARHVELIRAYRWLPAAEQVALANRVLSVQTLSTPKQAEGCPCKIDGEALNDMECAIISKLLVIQPIARELALIHELIQECEAWRH